MERARQEVGVGDRSARKSVDRARRAALEDGDSESLQQLHELANRLEKSGDLPYAIRQNLLFLSRRQPAEGTAARRRTPALVTLLGGVIGAVCALAFTYWLLHGAGGDGMTWFAGGLFFLFFGIPLGAVTAGLLWRLVARRNATTA